MGIFTPLIKELLINGEEFSTPRPYKEYKHLNGITSNAMTASILSIDYFDRLDSELRENNLMVFRLGSVAGNAGTNFALASAKNGFEDYFLFDELLLSKAEQISYGLENPESYSAFKLLPKLTETSLVNLSLASGVLQNALGIDTGGYQHIPATCQSTFSFPVKPHKDLDIIWQHQNGQVEIDALFCGYRNGKKELYLVESKFGQSHNTLAKHKLVYPYLAIKASLSESINIVPIYLKTKIEGNSINFMVTECRFKDNIFAVSNLKPLITKVFNLNKL